MIIKQAVFAGSSQDIEGKPQRALPEFAFIGRSNVGKSSLINTLCAKKGLAHTSATPGKTQLVNHFLINDQWYLVDLPGYGYAKVGKKGREKLEKIIDDYISRSKEMVLLFVLLDSRHDLQKIDLEFMIELGENGVPFSIIYTKCDKSGVNVVNAQIEKNNAAMMEYWEQLPPVFKSSSETGAGREEILDYIDSILKTI
ncbi:MAG: YihA family ribosome biogenesis GTP-binding protein [Bacteroidales bacterium]|nr:YihA family ribosome biogenesis GTP-binding protein [Candidatus Cacconaster merdequi]